MERVANAAGYAIVASFADDGVSGYVLDRPGLRDVFAAAESGLFGTLIVPDLNRLSRDYGIVSSILARLSDAGVRVETAVVDEAPLGNDIERRTMTRPSAATQALGAETSWAQAQERMAAGRRAAYGQGRLPHRPPYGFEVSNRAGQPRVSNDSVVVAEIFERSSNGVPATEIARDLTEMGRHRPGDRTTPGPWTADIVQRIVRSPIYRGVAVHNKTESGGRDESGRTKRRRVAPERWERIAVPHMRIVTDEIWDQANAKLGRRRGKR